MNGDLPGCSKRWSGTIGSYQYRTSRSPWAGAAAELVGDVADVSPAHHQPRPTPATSTSSRSEEHTSELQSLTRNSYAVFCLKKKKHQTYHQGNTNTQQKQQGIRQTLCKSHIHQQ